MVNLSKMQAAILRMLVANGPMYGLEMVRTSDGALKRGTIYVMLGRMEDKGLVRSKQEEITSDHIGLPRRIYEPTGLGERAWRAREAAEAAFVASPSEVPA